MKLVVRCLAEALPAEPTWSRLSVSATLPTFAERVHANRSRRGSPAFSAEPWDVEQRALLVRRLEERLAPLRPPIAVLDALRRCAHPQAGVVLATVPPGFLGGPLAHAFAALQVVRVAQFLSQVEETPFVPVLWIESDDWHMQRVHPAWLLNEHEDARSVGLSSLADDGTPFGLRRCDVEHDRLGPVVAYLRQLLAREPHVDEALAAFLPRADETWSQSAVRLALELFGGLGLVVVESSWFRASMAHGIADLLGPAHARRPLPLDDLWLAGCAATPDSEPARAAALVTHVENGRCADLHWTPHGLSYAQEPGSRTPRELAASIVGDPTSWYPAPALLPWAQERVMPVAARLVDWREACAVTRLEPLAEHAGAPLAPLACRLSATLVEEHVVTALARIGLSPDRILREGAELLASEAPPDPPVVRRLDAISAQTQAELRALEHDLDESERSLAHGVRRSARRLRDELSELRERARRLHANRSGKSRRHLGRAIRNLRPRNALQGDVLSPLPFVARYGTGLMGALFEALPGLPDHHALVFLETSAQDPLGR